MAIDFLERMEVSARAIERIQNILCWAYPEEDDFGYAGRLAILATAIDETAIRAGEDPIDAKNQIAKLGPWIEEVVKQGGTRW